MKFKRNNEPRVPWIYLQELSLLLDYKHSTIPNDLVALCTIHHTKHQKHTTLCASWWSWINFLSITLSFQLQYSSVIRESIFKRLELSWIASITSERCSNISSRSDELILERKKKAHSGTWTHNLLLRRQAPYPIRLCVLVYLPSSFYFSNGIPPFASQPTHKSKHALFTNKHSKSQPLSRPHPPPQEHPCHPKEQRPRTEEAPEAVGYAPNRAAVPGWTRSDCVPCSFPCERHSVPCFH